MTDYPDETPSSGHWDGKVRAESTMAAILGSAHRELSLIHISAGEDEDLYALADFSAHHLSPTCLFGSLGRSRPSMSIDGSYVVAAEAELLRQRRPRDA